MNPQSLQPTLDYLGSEGALRAIEHDPYWPKWDAPWWHMLALHELGRTDLIPERVMSAMIQRVRSRYVTVFGLADEPIPIGRDPILDTCCHCFVGTFYQLLLARGLEADQLFPWMRSWLSAYALPDGGFNCDADAYAHPEHPSSMVATVAVLEALLAQGLRAPLTAHELGVLDRGAACLLERGLVRGSATQANQEERLDEADWLRPCFPRFYFYDVLRGLSFVARWAAFRSVTLDPDAVGEAMSHLKREFPDGGVALGRVATDGAGSRLLDASGAWSLKGPESDFALLRELSRVGRRSPELTRQYEAALGLLQQHKLNKSDPVIR